MAYPFWMLFDEQELRVKWEAEFTRLPEINSMEVRGRLITAMGLGAPGEPT